MIGLNLFAQFTEEAGALSPDEADTLLEQGWSALIQAAKSQVQHQISEDVVRMFILLLMATITSGRAHFADYNSHMEPKFCTDWGWRQRSGGQPGEYQPMGNCIGWVDDPHIYLNPDAAFAEVQKLAQSQGSPFPIKPHTLWKRLAERKLLASTEPGRNTDRIVIHGNRRRIIHLTKTTLGVDEQIKEAEEAPQVSEEDGLEVRIDCAAQEPGHLEETVH
ncbi:MAG: hypothetical protein WC600_08740 [Desulfobaccales bacterium]